VPPLAVARPRHRDEVEAALGVCRDLEVPLTARGAGTSIAGNAVGPGLVLDLRRHLHQVLSLDPERATAVVEPGAVHATVQAAAREHGLRLGPDPSTHTRCTVGGMVGNNACGSRALGYGRTSENVLGLEVLTAAGNTLRLTAPDPGSAAPDPVPDVVAAARALVGEHLDVVRTQFGRFGRQVSGYALEHLLPERGGDLTRTLVGSEGTLALIQQVTLRLVRDEPHRVLVVLGFPDIGAAADAAPATLSARPTACEGIDRRLLEPLFRSGRRHPSSFPDGGAMLLVELAGEDPAEVRDRAERLLREAGADRGRVVDDPAEAAALWSVREDASGIAARTPDGAPAHAGWEDAAVPVERLGTYVRAFDALLGEHHLHALPYGHFGDGCVHVRVDFPLDRTGGREAYRRFVEDAAALVAEHGGSLSGEHGDGRARSGLLAAMYSPEALALQARLKRLLDPGNLLNPGVLVDPDAPDEALRWVTRQPVPLRRPPGLVADADELSGLAHRCTGVGKCVATGTTDVMCPSFRATGEEKDSTRGRARVLQDLAQGTPGLRWEDPAVAEALDLCLGCKACASDCPTGVDLARLRAETLYQRESGAALRRTRRVLGRPLPGAGLAGPRARHTLGRLPRWADLAARAPRAVNALTGGPLAPLVARAAGVDPRRRLPTFAHHTFLGSLERSGARRDTAPTDRPGSSSPAPVVLWVDTFTDHFAPQVAEAAVRVLEAAGHPVRVAAEPLCCGITEISTGRLDRARETLRPTVRALAAALGDDAALVGLEPSCLTVLRDDALHLLPDSQDARRVAAAARPLARVLLDTPGWQPPDLSGTRVLAQPHCHEHATTGWAAEEELLRRAGADLTVVHGCCGLAGDWGMTPDHHDTSVAVAELALLPGLRALPAEGVVVADGFSCRTQVADLDGRPTLHLAQLLDRASRRRPAATRPGSRPSSRREG
jgi:FAD/FMN-containing dehydrogenase/Fe-S oxidoreductase